MMSVTEYAKHCGVSPSAVSRWKRDGILKRSLTPGGKIRDVAMADIERKRATRVEHKPLTGPTAPKAMPDVPTDPDLGDARARHELAKAQLAEIDLAERRAELIQVAELDIRLSSLFASCKTKLLGIPSRARQADPKLTAAQVGIIEELVREALEDLSEGKLEVDAA